MRITSPAFEDGASIPKKYTGDGEDLSPPLRWTDVPVGAKSFALVCDDPDAPRGAWVHWVLFNIPAGITELDEGAADPAGWVSGKNDFGNLGYGGPAPPRGKPHRYFFKLYALDVVMNLRQGATKQQLEVAMQGHVLGHCQWMGRYQRS